MRALIRDDGGDVFQFRPSNDRHRQSIRRCHRPADRASGPPRPIRSSTAVSGILGAPPSRSMTAESAAAGIFQDVLRRPRGAIAPESCIIRASQENRARRECRVLAATHGPPAAKKQAAVTTGSAKTSRHSLRDGFNAYVALSLGTGLSCPHRPRDHHLANLASASGGQDHATSRPRRHRSSAHTRHARRHRIHRIPPHVR